nr:O-antigen ligase family protein [uncultured Flavobacterium sp.]
MNLKKINIVYGGILVSMLIAELSLASVINFNVIRFLQVLIFLNLFFIGFKAMENTILFVLPALIYFFHAIFYFNEMTVVGDFFNLIWWFVFMTIMNYSINSYDDFNRFREILFRLTFFFTTISSILGLLKLYFMSLGIILNYFEIVSPEGTVEISFGSSLNADYNVYAIGLYCGLFAGLYCYKNAINLKLKIAYSCALLLIITSAMLSGSRRGFVIGIFLLLYIIFWSFRSESSNKILDKLQKKKANILKKPWIAIVFSLVILISLTRLDMSSVIESSSEITNVFERLLTIEDISSQENDTRSNRWDYAFDYYSELPVLSKLFGDGFDYMKMFGYKFDVGASDYPHNVWISALLYGGLIGFVSTLGLTGYVLYYLYRRKSMFKEIFVWYILFLLLNFTSSNSIYSSRIFVVLLLFPFLSFCNIKKRIDVG